MGPLRRVPVKPFQEDVKVEEPVKKQVRFKFRPPTAAPPKVIPLLDELDTECMICCETMVEPTTLPCKHSFCVQCLNDWFKKCRECAYCRAVVPSNF